MYALKNIHITPYGQNLLRDVSKDLCKQFKHLLPDLRRVTIFLPNQLAQTSLREEILKETSKQGHDAIFPPEFISLRQWSRKQHPNKKPILSQYARELILVDAIKQQPDLFSSTNPWGIANELLSLFDSMLLNDVKPISFNKYYQGNHPELSQALLHESDLVKVLWKAWREQITDEHFIDPTEAYVNALRHLRTSNEAIFYCVGLDQLSKLECDFLNKLENISKLFFYTYASNFDLNTRADNWLKKYLNTHSQIIVEDNKASNPYSIFLNRVFEVNSKSIKQRAEEYRNEFTQNNIDTRLKTYKSNNFELHTKAIDIQIRLWIYKNIKNIGIVTTDRKLVRRLRAVLEHANITVLDAAGWALATTSAAVVAEWWLQLIEERYPAKQFVALANSPFLPVTEPELHQQAVNFFEKEIILKFNIHSGMSRYRKAVEKAQNNNESIDKSIFDYLFNLFDKFENSSQLLAKLHGYKTYPLHTFITELLNSLKPIGLYTNLNEDDAGKQIIELFENQIAHFKLIDNHMNWPECRRFISRILDQQNYKPPAFTQNGTSSVTFCSLEQSRLQSFDALVIASVDKANFSGNSNHYVFFNEQVRSELSIPTWSDDHARHLHQFRCLLESAEKILITVQTEKNGEKTTPCPWLEAIETFHDMAYHSTLSDQQLEYLVNQDTSSVIQDSEIPLPKPSTQPKPVLASELKPNKISISQYQSLVDCPYQYFALTCLKLSPTDELQEELNKADFGSMVHQCIHAFFSNVPSLPGPFTDKITPLSRVEAEAVLYNISKKVFLYASDNLNDEDFNNQLWLQRWLSLIPKFIDWEIKRETNHTPHSHETSVELNIDDSKAYGRLDRVDKSSDGYAIVDYKTGQTPSKTSVLSGEQVQLPMYALLHDANEDISTKQVEYVSIGDKNTVRTVATINDDELSELKLQHLTRLRTFFQSLNDDTPFTALANDETCQRCDAFGICRKSFWQN